MKQKQTWMQAHVKDPFVRAARAQGYCSRAAFKLLEIQKKDKIIRPGMQILDCGAAPGSWSQVAAELIGPRGSVIAIDRLELAQSLSGVTFIQGDLNDDDVYEALLDVIGDRRIDVVLSDLAPNLTGQKSVDQPASIQLLEIVLDLAKRCLRPGGSCVMKAFQGEGIDALFVDLKQAFKTVKVRKPASSRPRSAEMYLVMQGWRG